MGELFKPRQSIVSRTERDAFVRDGVVCLRRVFTDDWLDIAARGIEANLDDLGPYSFVHTPGRKYGGFYSDDSNWRRIPEYRRFAFESPAGRIASELMQSDCAIFFHDFMLVKEPGAAKPTPWHHDQAYWYVSGDQHVTLWMPVDPVGFESTLKFVRGSHRWRVEFRPTHFTDGSEYDRDVADHPPVPDIDAEPGQYEILSWELAPGDIVAFHGRTLHSAPGNTMTRRRRVLSTVWLGDDTRFRDRGGETAPAFGDHGLSEGNPMACDSFPVVWRAGRRSRPTGEDTKTKLKGGEQP